MCMQTDTEMTHMRLDRVSCNFSKCMRGGWPLTKSRCSLTMFDLVFSDLVGRVLVQSSTSPPNSKGFDGMVTT